jgi:hypothetical protein
LRAPRSCSRAWAAAAQTVCRSRSSCSESHVDSAGIVASPEPLRLRQFHEGVRRSVARMPRARRGCRARVQTTMTGRRGYAHELDAGGAQSTQYHIAPGPVRPIVGLWLVTTRTSRRNADSQQASLNNNHTYE